MSTAPSNSGIPDDWEDLAGDTLSVFSFSSGLTPHGEDVESPPPYCRGLSASPGPVVDEQCGQSASNVITSDQSLASGSAPATQSAATRDTHDVTTEAVNLETDPKSLYLAINSLLALVGDVDGTLPHNEVGTHCSNLIAILSKLQPVLLGYCSHCNSRGNCFGYDDLPLDPSIAEWLSQVTIELLGLQASWHQLYTQNASTSNMDSSTCLHQLGTHKSELERLVEHMTNFLPIIQADYDDFLTAQLELLVESPTVPSAASCGFNDPIAGPRPPSGKQFHLRRELYSLKDRITDAVEEIKAYEVKAPHVDNLEPLISALCLFQNIRKIMDVMMSNNATEWIECTLTGGLTYREFSKIDPVVVRSVGDELHTITDNLFLARSKFESEKGKDSEQREKLRVGDDDIRSLVSIEAFVRELLLIPSE